MELDDVYEEIENDPRWDHLRGPHIALVPGRGQTDRRFIRAMVVGEAPGATENLKRRPFCGPSGRVLDQLLESAGLYPEDDACLGGCGQQHAQYDCPGRTDRIADTFITNVVKYRPPGNRTPTTREILFGQEALRKEWAAIGRPRLIVTVGAPARAALTPVELRLSPGQWALLRDGRTYVYVQYHPQWGIRGGPRARAIMERQWEEMGTWLKSIELN